MEMPTDSHAVPMVSYLITLYLKKRETVYVSSQNYLSDPDNNDSVDQEVVYAICERQFVYHSTASEDLDNDAGISFVESLAISGDAVPDSFEQEETHGGLSIIPHLSEADLRNSHRSDQCIRHVITQNESGEEPSFKKRTC